MSQARLIVLADSTLPAQLVEDWRGVCQGFATFTAEPVEIAVGPLEAMGEVSAAMERSAHAWMVDRIQPVEQSPAASAAPMSAAEFVYREDGRPDWAAMWTGFCELALYGGPPHRGEADALRAVVEPPPGDGASDAIIEIRRGIYETTGLFAELAEPGWIAVTCASTKMAAWLCATIILENVEARSSEERLYLPASPDFRLKNEVKSIITVLAKTNHYWEAHVASQAAAIA